MNDTGIICFIMYYKAVEDDNFYPLFKTDYREVEKYIRTVKLILHREENIIVYPFTRNEKDRRRLDNINRAINILKEIIHRIEYIRNEKELDRINNISPISDDEIKAIEDVLNEMRKSPYHSVGRSATTMEFEPFY